MLTSCPGCSEWLVLCRSPTLPRLLSVAAVILTLQIQQLQSGLCYERETSNIKIPQEQVRHQEGILVDDIVTGFSLYILLLCCCFCSIKSLHSCFELRPSYLWLERSQAWQETGPKAGLITSETTTETILPLASSPHHWEHHRQPSRAYLLLTGLTALHMQLSDIKGQEEMISITQTEPTCSPKMWKSLWCLNHLFCNPFLPAH